MTKNLNIALVYGGYSGEYEVSVKSAQMVKQTLNSNKYNVTMVEISKQGWWANVGYDELAIHKEDFSFFDKQGNKCIFDFVYIIVHGTPGEDGHLQGYFNLLKIPYSTPGMLASALTANKFLSKKVVLGTGIIAAKGLLIHKNQNYSLEHIAKELGFPCFVKPNCGGSSVGTSKVYDLAQLQPAMNLAFEEEDTIIIEEFIQGREITQGAYALNGEIFTLPITEIIPHNDFFDYKAKYSGESDEITPAVLSEQINQKVSQLTKELYTLFQLKGLVRIDYIIKGDDPYFMEVNTVPGFSPQSIVPQQIRASGLKESDLLDLIIEDNYKNPVFI